MKTHKQTCKSISNFETGFNSSATTGNIGSFHHGVTGYTFWSMYVVGDILGVDWKEAFTVFTGVEGAMGVG